MTRWLIVSLAALAAGGSLPPAPAAPRTHTVEIKGMVFVPDSITVARGDTIVWINRDFVPHTATGQGGPAWDTGELAEGDSGRFVPKTAGALAYICALHPTMRGVVVVR